MPIFGRRWKPLKTSGLAVARYGMPYLHLAGRQTQTGIKPGRKAMKKTTVYFANDGNPEGAEIDCPDCGGDAIHNDSGTYCPNPDCPSNK